jgi:predicted heme/steroid binding protein/uncharacterized membrane protein/ActR/RegA family two-component response regulator
MEKIKILLIEDNPGDARLIKEMLAEEKSVLFDLDWKDTLSKGLERLAQGGIDVILLDLSLPDSTGFDTVARTQTQSPLVPIVVMTGLNDETLAMTAVKKGAQDYLIKGQVDSNHLSRSIRYAIARRLGDDRRITIRELSEFNGKNGRSAYIAFKENVYDVTNSKLWKEGSHSGKHFAGTDLTESIKNAPHNEKVFMKFLIVGKLSKEKSFAHKLVLKMEELHLHPMVVHFPIANVINISLFAFVYMFTGIISFEKASYYLLILGFLSSPIAGLSGIFSWKITYEGRKTNVFSRKIIFTAIFMVIITSCLIWRILDPEVLATTDPSYIYLALLLSMIPIVSILGHDGGKIIYS